jgi:hypothetical protein
VRTICPANLIRLDVVITIIIIIIIGKTGLSLEESTRFVNQISLL